MTPSRFFFDISRCSGCMACVVACLDQNDLPEDSPGFRDVTRIETGSYPFAEISFVSISCFNCTHAPCVMVCPTRAIKRRIPENVVEVNQDLCIGCRSCLMVCPFGATRFLEGKRMSECHFCSERIKYGMEPACVRICPTRALDFGPVERAAAENQEKAPEAEAGSI
jgi:anaerobic dimethyl sulfoxide reductase subunit B (iron-sulfur subunit)